MNTGTILLLAGAGLVAYEFQQLGTAAATVQFQFAGVTFNSITSLNVQLLIQNISNIKCTVNALSGQIIMNDLQIGNISDFQPVDIAARSQQVVNVLLSLNVLSIPGTIQSLLNNPGAPLDFEIIGNANVNGLILPFDLTKTIAA